MPGRHYLLIALTLALIAAWPSPSPAESNVFVDDDNHRFEPYLDVAGSRGILPACDPPAGTRSCPELPIIRGVMAMMLARAIGAPSGDEAPFDDIEGHPSETAVKRLTAAGVVVGCAERRFCPDRPLTRGELATFIATALGWKLPTDTAPYLDLASSPHGPALTALARHGGLQPCDPPIGVRLCPERIVSRAEAAYSLITGLGLQPMAAVVTTPDSQAIGYRDDFTALALWDGRKPSSRNRVSLTEGYRGSGLRVVIPKGSHFGADFRLDLSSQVGEEPELLYFRYMLRFDPDWATKSSGKLPGFSGVYGGTGKGGYPSSASSPGWSARLQWFPAKEGDNRVPLGFYVYHLGQSRTYGDSMMWSQAGRLIPGQWYCVEGEVHLNTPGLADGALRAWVDQTSVFDVSGLAFRRPGEPDIRIESFWFDVYYGGKSVADRNLGLVIDEVRVDTHRVGCDVGDAASRPLTGDFTGNGYKEYLWWDLCPGGDCIRMETPSEPDDPSSMWLGSSAWFSLETLRSGMAAADLDGDGMDELVYPGRCQGGVRCWRVHHLEGNSWSVGQDWGSGASLAPYTESIIAGDWDGDGLDDLAYSGACGEERLRCWAVQSSIGDKMAKPADWGSPPSHDIASPRAADLNGDGFDDLVYHAPCGETTCWLAQLSTAASFRDPIELGKASRSELAWSELFDWNGDGRADIVSVESKQDGDHYIQLRLMEAKSLELGGEITVAEYDRPVNEVLLKRPGDGYPVEALVSAPCDEGASCVDRLVSAGTTLISSGERERLMALTRSTIWRCEFEFVFGFGGCHSSPPKSEVPTETDDINPTLPSPVL